MTQARWLLLAGLLCTPPLCGAERERSASAEEVQTLRNQVELLSKALESLRAELERERVRLDAATGAAFEARLTALQAQVVQLQQELRQAGEARREAQDSVARVADAETRRPSTTVYGTLDAYRFGDSHSILDGKAFELVLSGRPHPRLGFFAELEFERVAGVGGERGGEVVVEQAYANLSFSPAFNLRAGVLLIPFGNVNIDHYAPQRDVIGKPLTSYVIAPSDWTDNGLGAYGRVTLGESWRLSYEGYLVAGLGAQIDSLGTRLARQGYGVDNNGNKAVVGRLAFDRLGRLQLGLSGYTGKYDDANRLRLDGWAADGLVWLGPLKLTGEYDDLRAQRSPAPDTRLRGFYGRAVLGLGRRALPPALTRDFESPALQAVFQFDQVTLDGPLGPAFVRNRERRQTFGLNYRPTRQWVLKLDYELNDTSLAPLVQGDRDGWLGSIGFVF